MISLLTELGEIDGHGFYKDSAPTELPDCASSCDTVLHTCLIDRAEYCFAMTVEQITDEVLALPDEARAQLADRLVESLDPGETVRSTKSGRRKHTAGWTTSAAGA